MTENQKRAALIAIALITASFLGGVMNAVNASQPVMFAAGAAALALIVALGVPWAFGPQSNFVIKNGQQMRSDEPAVWTSDYYSLNTGIGSGGYLVRSQRWEVIKRVRENPSNRRSAGRALATERVSLSEDLMEPVESLPGGLVGHLEEILGPSGSH